MYVVALNLAINCFGYFRESGTVNEIFLQESENLELFVCVPRGHDNWHGY